jgi:hypothetical protein
MAAVTVLSVVIVHLDGDSCGFSIAGQILEKHPANQNPRKTSTSMHRLGNEGRRYLEARPILILAVPNSTSWVIALRNHGRGVLSCVPSLSGRRVVAN